VAGGQRCGTTWLYHLLDAHPEIYMAKPPRPEPKFFMADPRPGRDVDWYLNTWFSDTGDAKAIGEKSTSYMETPGTAVRIRRLFPDLRVLVILRNPVERAISNFAFSRRNGLEHGGLDEALTDEERRVREIEFANISVHPFAYSWRSLYARHLRQFFDELPREQLGVFLYDDLRENPTETCGAIYGFLGVDSGFDPGDFDRRYNESPLVDLGVKRASIEYLRDKLRRPNHELAALLGRDLSCWDEISPAVEALIED
ncbi:MAG: sulfotransferase, partial [Planctomycetes bacterium]|nr:sulfotransferase [Planctomycetota bacterium]